MLSARSVTEISQKPLKGTIVKVASITFASIAPPLSQSQMQKKGKYIYIYIYIYSLHCLSGHNLVIGSSHDQIIELCAILPGTTNNY